MLELPVHPQSVPPRHRQQRIPIMNAPETGFAARVSIEQVEEGNEFAPRFDEHGLLPVVTTDAASGELLMHGYMNPEALRLTIATGEAHYWSRSRQCLWRKGATSGFVQHVAEMYIDDDQDTVWLRVRVDGGASCHVGYRSCFYRRVPLGRDPVEAPPRLDFTETERVFNPVEVYGDAPNPTRI
jgi:phosphoribosyl-AMP cyclohydrolase